MIVVFILAVFYFGDKPTYVHVERAPSLQECEEVAREIKLDLAEVKEVEGVDAKCVVIRRSTGT